MYTIYFINFDDDTNYMFNHIHKKYVSVLFPLIKKYKPVNIHYNTFNKLKDNELNEKDIIFCYLIYFDIYPQLYNKKCRYIFVNTECGFLKEHKRYKAISNTIKKCYGFIEYNFGNLKKYYKEHLNIYFLPPAYHIMDEKITKQTKQKEFDVIFYGVLTKRRRNIFNKLKDLKVKCDSYKTMDKLDENIAKAKICPVIYSYEYYDTFDFYRASYLIANKVLIIHENFTDKIFKLPIVKKLSDKIITCKYEDFPDKIRELSQISDVKREELITQQYRFFKNEWNMNILAKKCEQFFNC